MTTTIKRPKTDYRNSPTAWFSMLEGAIDRSNFERAAEAVRQLDRLGVTVRYRGKQAKKLAEAKQELLRRKQKRKTVLAG